MKITRVARCTLLITVLSHATALLSQESGVGQTPDAQTAAGQGDEHLAEVPTLLFLAWQKGGDRATGQSVSHTVWDLKGQVLEQSKADALLKGVQSFDIAWREDGQLNPLSLVFQVDRQLTQSPIKPTVITADGRRHTGMSARIAPENGLIVSAAVPRKRLLAAWPEKISLEVTYPVENVTLVKTIREVPDAPISIAPGVRWCLDATRARESDPENRRLVRAPGKTAGVLEVQRDREDELTEYGVRIYERNSDKQVRNLYATIVERDGHDYTIRVSLAFEPKAFDRVEIMRQRYKLHRFDNVPLRLDLLPDTEEN